VALDFMGNKMPVNTQKLVAAMINTEINLSVINKIELLGFSKVEQSIIDFVEYATVFPIDDAIVAKTIEIRRTYKIKLPDALIAATAFVYNLTLVTRNSADFQSIDGITLINPYTV
jgi:predicted nucleic acid-binding protein